MTELPIDNQHQWPVTKKLLTLFLVSYLFFYMFPFPLDQVPHADKALAYYTDGLDFITKQIGKHLLGISPMQRIEDTGSGDTTFDYVNLLTTLLLAIVASCIVFIFTRKRKNYEKPYEWIIVYARYFVGLYMVIYGISKLDNEQFISPSATQLDEPYGNSSPMGLLWTFMGYSKSYTVFSGLGEILGGCLLFFRKTTVLGCLITIAVMSNVVMMNFCYDVPVKIFSGHLLLISMIILAPYFIRLYEFFILNRTSEIVYPKLDLQKKWMRITRYILKPVLIFGIVGFTLYGDHQNSEEAETNPALFGSYKTELFIRNNDTIAPLTTDSTRWSKLIIDDGYAAVTTMNDHTVYYETDIDTSAKTIAIQSYKDSAANYVFTYKNIPGNRFFLTGEYKDDSISVSFQKKSPKDYLLMKRGFHWINEYPFNR